MAVKFVSANVFTIGIFRLSVATVCSYLLLRIWGGHGSLPRRHWLVLASLGAIFALHWLTFFMSIKIGSASIASIGLSTYGIHLIILGWFFQRTTITVTDGMAIIMAIAGSLIVVPEFSMDNNATRGVCLSVFSALLYAMLPIIHQRFPQLPSSTRAFGQFLFGLFCFLAFWPFTNWHLDARDWTGLVFLGVACTFVAHSLWVRVTTMLSTITTSIISYLVVPLSLLLSFLVLHEPMPPSKLAGAAIIIAANLVALRSQWKRKAFRAEV